MQNKFLSITFNDLNYFMRQRISKILAQEVCKRIKTPPINDPCIDQYFTEESIYSTLSNLGNDTLFELDIEEVGKEAGILK